jgi:hypothetical protein
MNVARVTLSCAAMLSFGACSAEPAQTSDLDAGERVESTRQELSTCVDVQRGLYGTVDDTYITSAGPTSANGSYVSIYSGQDGAAGKRALLKFDLGFIPAGSTIDSATLTLSQRLFRSGQPGYDDRPQVAGAMTRAPRRAAQRLRRRFDRTPVLARQMRPTSGLTRARGPAFPVRSTRSACQRGARIHPTAYPTAPRSAPKRAGPGVPRPAIRPPGRRTGSPSTAPS